MNYCENVLRWLEVILLERYGVQFALKTSEGKVIITAPHQTSCIEVLREHTSFADASENIPCAEWNARSCGFEVAIAEFLPAPGATVLPAPLIVETDSGFRIGYDLLALAAWMMTRKEEVGYTMTDSHDRFPASASHAFRYGYLHRPIVDEWFFILSQVIRATWPELVLRRRDFRCLISHDVDRPSRTAFVPFGRFLGSMASDLVRRRDLAAFVKSPITRWGARDRLHPADPVNTFSWLMSVSERHDLKSAFYFICGRTDPDKDAHYEPEHPAIRGLMREIHARGHEIGLHPSYGTYRDPSRLAAEAERLKRICAEERIEQPAWGGRMHFLRWSHPMTLRAWADAGMTYDSTLGYAEMPGFRCGTCHEFPGFDPERMEILDIRVRPLIAMEASFLSKKYLGVTSDEAVVDAVKSLSDACKAVGGDFTILWHNSELWSPGLKRLYQNVLEEVV